MPLVPGTRLGAYEVTSQIGVGGMGEVYRATDTKLGRPLFDAPIQAGYTADSHRWQVAPDGKRFLLLPNDGKNEAAPLDVVVNWPVLLKK